jgi:antirestriction protein ArdC
VPDEQPHRRVHAWRKLGRNVRKGEKGIWILAPMTYKVADNDDRDNDTEARVLRGFKPVPVFDIAQTDGEELPEVCTRLDGDDNGNVFTRLRAVADSLGFNVEDSDELPGAVNGDCSHDLHRIRVRSSNSPVQRVKTLAHELAHAILHEEYDSRPLAELEAESVAFVVCHNLDITSDDYSFGYVATWAGGGDEAQKAIKTSGGRIQRAAEQILSTVEAASASLAA